MGSEFTVVLGIGINVNQTMSETEFADEAVSVSDVLGHQIDREKFLADFCNELERLLTLQFSDILELYRHYDLLVGKNIVIMPKKRESPEREYAKAVAISDEGVLIVEYEDGTTKELIAEEVSIRPEEF
eukprot:TRINITY_DN2935_c0_g3_i2.p1 TRINITY_DN2935_c0_g3~~TRINITY_DN2935_c0_g3_i2.p1  ORF type:complete len:129 (-),score=35.27 TRINITY_DN2935_c0_g3_i2:124-510(-)